MSEAEIFLDQFEEDILKQVKYLKAKPWHEKKEEHPTQFQITNSLLNRLQYFLDNGGREILELKSVRNFVDSVAEGIAQYPNNVTKYLKDPKNSWSKGEDEDVRQKELAFQDTLMGNSISVKTQLVKLNVSNEIKSLVVPIEGDKTLPFLMRDRLKKEFPQIQKFIDQETEGVKVKTPNNRYKFFKDIENPPMYDPSKHFFEQDPEVIKFYEIEEKKIKEGLTIDGYFIHPWLYFHANFFNTPIPQEDGTEPIMLPPLRDNELYFAHNIMRAETHESGGRGIAIWGSRRYAKSTMIASYTIWKALTKENSSASVVGGDETDINSIASYIKTALSYMTPAFKMPTNKQDYTKEIIFGLKHKTGGTPIEYSRIKVTNVNAGKSSSDQKTAGASPSSFIIDEFGKFKSKSVYEAAQPSFEAPFGWKAIPFLVGTGGNEELSQDARDMVYNPEAYKLLEMDWDWLEDKVPDPELITWKRRKYACFVPAQMSYKTGIVKIKSNLAEYFKIDSKKLAKIEVFITDWKQALEVIKKDRADKSSDKDTLNKEKMYYPIDPDEPFLLRHDNPFPAERAQQLIQELKDTGEIGKAVDIYLKMDGTLGYTFSDKEVITEFPFRGGNHDAPILIFGDPPDKMVPPKYLNTAGLDPYNQVSSETTPSLGALYILRRGGVPGDPFGWSILASYVSRPNRPDDFDSNCMDLIIGYNAECLMECADTGFIRFMEREGNSHYLAEGLDFARSISAKTKQSSRYGLYPTPKNTQHVINRVLQYCNEELVLGEDDNGNLKTDLGVTRIPDIYLLEEITRYYQGGNFDRIVAFGHALCWAEWLDEMRVPVYSQIQMENRKKNKKKRTRKSGFYSKPIGGFHK